MHGELVINGGANVSINEIIPYQFTMLHDTRVTFNGASRVAIKSFRINVASKPTILTWNIDTKLVNIGLPNVTITELKLANLTVIVSLPSWLSVYDIPEVTHFQPNHCSSLTMGCYAWG